MVVAALAAIAVLSRSPAESTDPSQLPDAANTSPFYEEISVDADQVVTRFVPWDPAPANYTLSYQVKRDVSGDDRLTINAPGASRNAPIDVVIPRQMGEEVTVIVEIFDETGALVHSSEGTYA
ncbi:MAG: hypothetical protein EHJ95_02510 [Methanobacteriota archaeon]|nr:MAG: hypothetical protein EHJ95_02510 [Euryarchaeota archaeon]